MANRPSILFILLCVGIIILPARGYMSWCAADDHASHHVHLHVHDGFLHAHHHHHKCGDDSTTDHTEINLCNHSHSEDCPAVTQIILTVPRRDHIPFPSIQYVTNVAFDLCDREPNAWIPANGIRDDINQFTHAHFIRSFILQV